MIRLTSHHNPYHNRHPHNPVPQSQLRPNRVEHIHFIPPLPSNPHLTTANESPLSRDQSTTRVASSFLLSVCPGFRLSLNFIDMFLNLIQILSLLCKTLPQTLQFLRLTLFHVLLSEFISPRTDHVFGGFFSFVEGVARGCATGSSSSNSTYNQYQTRQEEAINNSHRQEQSIRFERDRRRPGSKE